MELADFEFKQERKLSEFVQDFINLLKVIFPHLVKTLFRLLAFPLAGMLLIGFYISTQINLNVNYSSGEVAKVVFSFLIAGLSLFIITMIAFAFSIEYFVLLRERKSTDFTHTEVFDAFKANIGKYFKFLFAAFIVGILATIPIAFGMMLSMFIPLVGSFAAGILIAIVGLWFFTSFMLYREGYEDLTDAFTSGFSILKKKIFEYGIASYIVTFIFQSLLTLMTIVPAIIFFFIGYNYVGFNNDFFNTFFGKFLVTSGSILLTVLFVTYYMLAVISYGIIYESAKELKFGENIFSRIQRLGRRVDD